MAINTKKPAMKQTVGAQYTCFANATEAGDYDGTYEDGSCQKCKSDRKFRDQ